MVLLDVFVFGVCRQLEGLPLCWFVEEETLKICGVFVFLKLRSEEADG